MFTSTASSGEGPTYVESSYFIEITSWLSVNSPEIRALCDCLNGCETPQRSLSRDSDNPPAGFLLLKHSTSHVFLVLSPCGVQNIAARHQAAGCTCCLLELCCLLGMTNKNLKKKNRYKMGLLSLKVESIPTVPLRAAASATAALHSHDTSVSEASSVIKCL